MGGVLFPGTSHGRSPRAPSRHPSSGVSPNRPSVQSSSTISSQSSGGGRVWPQGRIPMEEHECGTAEVATRGAGIAVPGAGATVAIIGVGKGKVVKPLKTAVTGPGEMPSSSSWKPVWITLAYSTQEIFPHKGLQQSHQTIDGSRCHPINKPWVHIIYS